LDEITTSTVGSDNMMFMCYVPNTVFIM